MHVYLLDGILYLSTPGVPKTQFGSKSLKDVSSKI